MSKSGHVVCVVMCACWCVCVCVCMCVYIWSSLGTKVTRIMSIRLIAVSLMMTPLLCVELRMARFGSGTWWR